MGAVLPQARSPLPSRSWNCCPAAGGRESVWVSVSRTGPSSLRVPGEATSISLLSIVSGVYFSCSLVNPRPVRLRSVPTTAQQLTHGLGSGDGPGARTELCPSSSRKEGRLGIRTPSPLLAHPLFRVPSLWGAMNAWWIKNHRGAQEATPVLSIRAEGLWTQCSPRPGHLPGEPGAPCPARTAKRCQTERRPLPVRGLLWLWGLCHRRKARAPA